MEAFQTLLAHPFPPSETKQVVQSKVIDTENKYRYKYQVQCGMGPSTVKSIMPLKLHEKLETFCTSSSSSGSSSVFGSEMIDRDWPHSTYSHFDRSPRSKVISCTHTKTRWAFHAHHLHWKYSNASTFRYTDITTESAILLVGPVVPMVPDALYAQEVLIGGGVALACERVNEEVLRYLPVPWEHQNPAVNSQAQKRVGWWMFTLLFKRNRWKCKTTI